MSTSSQSQLAALTAAIDKLQQMIARLLASGSSGSPSSSPQGSPPFRMGKDSSGAPQSAQRQALNGVPDNSGIQWDTIAGQAAAIRQAIEASGSDFRFDTWPTGALNTLVSADVDRPGDPTSVAGMMERPAPFSALTALGLTPGDMFQARQCAIGATFFSMAQLPHPDFDSQLQKMQQ